MADIRKRVEEDRGLLKKIQLHVPGYAGYRRREDIRTADVLLRNRIADKIAEARKKVEKIRTYMTENYISDNLEKLGNLIFTFQAVEGKVRHAESGYSGLSAMIRIEENELDKLYEYDYAIVESLEQLMGFVPTLEESVTSGDKLAASDRIGELRDGLAALESAFSKRVEAITGTAV